MAVNNSMHMNLNPVSTLLVEDDVVDIKAVKRGFQKYKIANPLIVAKDGIEALKILRGDKGQPKISHPYITLLDLNMPIMNGLEFLEVLRSDKALSTSVVFVLTTSKRETDRIAAYKKQVAGYVIKDNAGTDFLQLVAMLDAYLQVVDLP